MSQLNRRKQGDHLDRELEEGNSGLRSQLYSLSYKHSLLNMLHKVSLTVCYHLTHMQPFTKD